MSSIYKAQSICTPHRVLRAEELDGGGRREKRHWRDPEIVQILRMWMLICVVIRQCLSAEEFKSSQVKSTAILQCPVPVCIVCG